jgi:hypothetical protein
MMSVATKLQHGRRCWKTFQHGLLFSKSLKEKQSGLIYLQAEVLHGGRTKL